MSPESNSCYANAGHSSTHVWDAEAGWKPCWPTPCRPLHNRGAFPKPGWAVDQLTPLSADHTPFRLGSIYIISCPCGSGSHAGFARHPLKGANTGVAAESAKQLQELTGNVESAALAALTSAH